MFYIFEGIDLSGKSYLAEKKAKELNTCVLHKEWGFLHDKEVNFLKEDKVEVLSEFFIRSIMPLAGIPTPIVLDRSMISSLVYGKYFNRNYDFNYVYKFLFSLAENHQVEIRYIHANRETIEHRFKSRGEKYFTVDDLMALQDIYEKTVDFLIDKGICIIKVDNSNWDLSLPLTEV